MTNHMELDFLGEAYASKGGYLGLFSLSVHLTEQVNPQILQQAFGDLMRRLPFLSVRLCPGYLHEVLEEPPPVVPESGSHYLFTEYFNRGSRHMLRVLYGEYYFKVETTHTITDGRGLSKIVSALLLRYYELTGIKVDENERGGIIDCAGMLQPAETEDAYKRFASAEQRKHNRKEPRIKNVYMHEQMRRADTRVISRTFDLEKIKVAAKSHDATIGEYILAHIFAAIAMERDETNCKGSIVITVPVDYRRFFVSKTFRNFVGSKNIVIHEAEGFPEMLSRVKSQFASLDKNSVQIDITGIQEAKDSLRKLPPALRGFLYRTVGRRMMKKTTSMFSNLGVVKLPRQIEEHIKSMELVLSPTEGILYTFACITLGNVLTLSITSDAAGDGIVNEVFRTLE